MNTEQLFQYYTKKVKETTPKDTNKTIDNNTKLSFYKYFKQATVGNNNTEQPYFYQVVERAKWDAWNEIKNMSKEEAMKMYIYHASQFISSPP
jgi:diazepam-binding inhibitor (GABA receptor modulating acyl-CoA-binding protein)